MSDKNTAKNTIVLEGEAEYKKALGDINSKLRESKSAMKAAAAEYDAAGNSMEAMCRYGDSLERTMESQNAALGLMSEHLDRVEACYGKNSREANKLRTDINNMRTELAKTQTQMRQFESSMDAASDAGDDLKAGMDAGSAGLEQVGEAAGRANEDVQELSQSIADMMGKKIIDFAVGKEMLSTLSDGLKWAMGEAMNGIADQNKTQAITNTDAETAAMLVRVQDAVKRQFAQYINDDQARGLIGDLWTGMGKAGYTPTEEEMTRLAPQIFGVSQAKGIDTGTLINAAQTLTTEFGEGWQRSFDLLDTLGAATVGHAQEAISAMGTYSEVFRQAGYDADDMFSIMISGAQEFGVENLGDLGKNLATFEKNLTGGSKEVDKALKALGVEITDLPGKFQEGGEAAQKAFSEILTRILSIEDKGKQADIAKAFFGDMNWTKNGADMAQLFLQGFNTEMDVSGQAQRTAQLWGDTLDNNLAGLGERMNQQVGSILEKPANMLNEFLKNVNDQTDKLGGDVLKGASQASANLIGEKFDGLMAGMSIDPEAMSRAGSMAGEKWAEGYAESVGQATDQAVQDAAQNTEPVDVGELIKLREQAIDEDNEALATALDKQIQAAILKGQETGQEGGRQIGEDTSGAVTDAFTAAETNMQSAGETLGEEGVSGLEEGLEGMTGASADTVNTTVATLYGGAPRAYSAGKALAAAFVRGYKNELRQASPSRVMREAAQDTVSPLFDEFEQDRARLYEAAAGLAQAVSEGYGDSAALRVQAPAGDAQEPGAGISAGVLAEAVRQALGGAGVYLDGQRVGELTAPGVSAGIARSAAATVRGRSARTKGW